MAETRGVVFVNRTFDGKSFHQADGAERKCDSALENSVLKEIHFQAAAAEIEDEAGLNAVAESALDGGTNEGCFFFAADHFQLDAGLAADAVHQAAVVARFAGCGSGDGAIGGDVMLVHLGSKLAEGADSAINSFFVEQAARKSIVSEADRCAFAIEDFDVLRRGGAGDDETNRVGAGVNRSEMDRGGHSQRQR